jgi:hypothetical protein
LSATVCMSKCTAQVAVRQTLLPTMVRWLPHNTGYFLILFYTTALVINLMGCIWCVSDDLIRGVFLLFSRTCVPWSVISCSRLVFLVAFPACTFRLHTAELSLYLLGIAGT